MREIAGIAVEALSGGALITALVVTMMMLIEYLNIGDRGRCLSALKGSGAKQIFIACLLGLIPGCIGGFAAVSLYTHGILSFGALCSAMICSLGDESFAIIGTMPLKYLQLLALLFLVALASGFAIEAVRRAYIGKKSAGAGTGPEICPEAYVIHGTEESNNPSVFRRSSYKNLMHPGRERIILLIGILIFAAALFIGLPEEHSAGETGAVAEAEAPHGYAVFFSERWLNCLFGLLALLTLLLTATASEHFIREHIWRHLIKKHLPAIFFWTFAALLMSRLITDNIDIAAHITDYMPAVILLAALIGFIPESGPHLVFVIMCANGSLPFYILLTSSISQQGHVSLPLLAQSKRKWIAGKLICAVTAAAAGFCGMLLF